CATGLLAVYASTPELSSPSAGSSLSGSEQAFSWAANDNSVQRWNLRIGSKPGRADYFKSSNITGTDTGVVALELPADARKLYVRLRYRIAGTWNKLDYIYYAAGANNPPTITGSPKSRINVGKTYNFKPKSTETDRETKTFTISNQPGWATFNTSNGKLTGTPDAADAGLYENIVISVNDERGGSATLPAFSIDVNTPPEINGSPATRVVAGAYYEFTPAANDADDDPLTFRKANKPSWAKFNKHTGQLSGTPTAADIGTTDNVRIRVRDDNGGVATLPLFSITVTGFSAVDNALKTIDTSGVTETELLDAALAELANKKAAPALLDDLYSNEAISYSPGNRTQLLNIKPWVEAAFPIIAGNKGKTLAMAGTTANTRYAAFGISPTELFDDGDTAYETQFSRVLEWLLTGEATADTTTTTQTIALSNTAGDRSHIRAWFAAKHPDWTVTDCNIAAELPACYASADLVMTGWQGNNEDAPTIRQALADTMAAGTPVLYVHTWYEAYNDVAHAIADLLNFSLPYGGNYWANDSAVWGNVAEMQAAIWQQQGLAGIETMLNHFKANDYSFNWDACNGENCSGVAGLAANFLEGAEKVRSIMRDLDSGKVDLFATEDSSRLMKLLALLGDKYRQ
ncbi:MAG: putative Ig domain-containing protein, partial [Thiolinea sp.]